MCDGIVPVITGYLSTGMQETHSKEEKESTDEIGINNGSEREFLDACENSHPVSYTNRGVKFQDLLKRET